MPQILIREKDYTRPGLTEYSNYSVVVPGFVSETCDIPTVFDENGVCEISSQSEFEAKIGKVAPKRLAATTQEVVVNTPIYFQTNAIQLQIENQGAYKHHYAIMVKSVYNDLDDLTDTGLTRFKMYEGVGTEGQELTHTITEDGENYFLYYVNESEQKGIEIANSTTSKVTISLTDESEDDRNRLSHYKIKVKDLGVVDEEGEEGNNNFHWKISPYKDDEGTWHGGEGQAAEFDTKWIVAESDSDAQLGRERTGTNSETVEQPVAEVSAHYGNQIAYLLLGLGYPVVYVNMGKFNGIDVSKQEMMGNAITALGTSAFWAGLRDKSVYDYRFIVTGLLDSTAYIEETEEGEHTITGSEAVAAAKQIALLAAFEADNGGEVSVDTVSVRGDATALIDVDETLIEIYRAGQTTQTATIQAIQQAINATGVSYGQYAAYFVPSVCYAGIADDDYDANNKLPASFHYLACFINSLQRGNPEWFAAAGMNRGISSLTIESTAYKLGEIAVNTLEPRSVKTSIVPGAISCNVSCNVIAKVRSAYYLWGNRTAYQLTEGGDLVASHFLNIRQLCSTLKKQIYVSCRRFTFDPNSDVLWINFVNSIKPTLERMKANQGIGDYKIIQVATTQKAKLKARIRIIPIEAVEDFDIEISLEDSFGGVNATITE